MSDFGLSSQQLDVICALSSGATMTGAAQQAGVHRNTINYWRRNSPPFQFGLAQAQYAKSLYYREKMEDMADIALQAIREIVADPKTPSSVRLRAALAVATTAATPPAPMKQVELDIEKLVIKSQPHVVTEDQLAPDPAPAPENAAAVHNSAQTSASPEPASLGTQPPTAGKSESSVHKSAQTPHSMPPKSAPARPKIGRNEPCPCGSGRKYKRCCLDKPFLKSEFAPSLKSEAAPLPRPEAAPSLKSEAAPPPRPEAAPPLADAA